MFGAQWCWPEHESVHENTKIVLGLKNVKH